MWSCKDPVVILYYSPPYYPHNYVKGNTKKEAKLLDAIEHVARTHEGRYKIINRKFYPYISDLSFASAPGDDRILALESNMPAYGTRYHPSDPRDAEAGSAGGEHRTIREGCSPIHGADRHGILVPDNACAGV